MVLPVCNILNCYYSIPCFVYVYTDGHFVSVPHYNYFGILFSVGVHTKGRCNVMCLNTVEPSYNDIGFCNTSFIRGGADKSLARSGRKQATATKRGIYSTYSPTKLNTLLSPFI